MTLPEVHLAGVAVAALIDGELSRAAYHRALDHMVRCAECRTAVGAQRQAKATLVAAAIPAPPNDLLSRLHAVPMTTDLGGPRCGLLAVVDGELVLLPPNGPPGPPAASSPPGTASPTAARRGPRGQRSFHPRRPRPYPIGRARSIRLRRSLAGTLAGLAVGVATAASPIGSTAGLQQSGVVNREPQVVPARVGFGLDLGTRSAGNTDRSARSSSRKTLDQASLRGLVVHPR